MMVLICLVITFGIIGNKEIKYLCSDQNASDSSKEQELNMIKYVLKRVMLAPFMLLMNTFIIFSLVNMTPSSPGLIILGAEAGPQEVEMINKELGLDQPFLNRYIKYVGDAVRGDLGYSYYTKRDVFAEIMYRLPYTLILTFSSLALAIAIGLPLGLICAVKQYSAADNIPSTLAMFFSAMPSFWLSLMLMMLFSLKLGLLPSSGIAGGWKSWVLPIITLAMPYIGVYLRYSRSSMLDTIRQDYVNTARSKGNTEKDVIIKHAFRNALLPLVTITGLFIGTLMSSAVVVETVFSIPGLGTFVLDAIKRKDIPIAMGCILFFSIIFIIVTLIMDILYAYIDPRIKAMYMSYDKDKRKTKKAPKEGVC